MRLKIAPNDLQSMSQDGDAILRSLQNKSLPMIDLMVRESLQNSLDATLEKAETTKVDFTINKFHSESLAPHFEKISDRLIEKFPGEQGFISVGDKNTSGLTGDFASNNQAVLEDSNFQKLVFGIGKNQDKEGAGGSWGLGKTSYFRMGIGIVIYYTRVHTENGYEERLIASLIESPKQENRVLEESARGIAWWGEFDASREKIYPITNHKSIENVLKIFGLKNYINDETGTIIIVPYLKQLEIEQPDDEDQATPWDFNPEKALSLSVQRWYSPRIWNEKYAEKIGNSQLDCSINGIGIHPEINMEPVFNLFRDLYTSALISKPLKENIKVSPIKIPRKALADNKEAAGFIAFCEVSREDLKMTPPDNKYSGLAYLGVRDKGKIDKNISKVVAYSRKPGMIVEYSVDEDWSPTGLIQKEDHLLFGFFVPNSKALLQDSYQKMGYKNLENYLRATENADHANWVDEANITIIRRLKQYTSQAIQDEFQDSNGNENTSATSALSRKFGAILMPPKNFGKTSAVKGFDKKDKRDVDNRDRISDIDVVGSNPIDEKNVEINFRASIKKESKSNIFFQILTQDKKIDISDWEKIMGENNKFPFSIQNIFLDTCDDEMIEEVINSEFENNLFDLKIADNVIEITSKVSTRLIIEGTIFMNISSNQYLPNIAIRTINKKEAIDE